MLTDLKILWNELDKKSLKVYGLFVSGIWFLILALFYMMASSGVQTDVTDDTLTGFSKDFALEEGATPSSIQEEPASYSEFDMPEVDLYAHRELMEKNFKKGDMEKSFHHLERISPYFQNDTNFLKRSSELYYNIGNYETALVSLEKALNLMPNNSKLEALKILSIYRGGEASKAIMLGSNYLKTNPDNLDLLVAMGTMDMEMNISKPGVVKYLERALKIAPHHVPALYQIGRKHKLQGNFKDALHLFDKVLKLEPANANARGQLGSVYFYLGQDTQAKKEYETALSLNPKDYNTWYNFGELHLLHATASGSIKKKGLILQDAFNCYQNSLKHNPYHEKAHFRIGVLLNGNKQYKEAIEHFKFVIEKSPDNIRALLQIAASFEQLGNLDKARDYLNRAYRLNPLDKRIIYKLRQLS